MKHNHKVLKAGAAGMAKQTYGRKAGAQDGPSRAERLERIERKEAEEEMGETEPYLVKLEVHVPAKSPEEAAKKVQELLRAYDGKWVYIVNKIKNGVVQEDHAVVNLQ